MADAPKRVCNVSKRASEMTFFYIVLSAAAAVLVVVVLSSRKRAVALYEQG